MGNLSEFFDAKLSRNVPNLLTGWGHKNTGWYRYHPGEGALPFLEKFKSRMVLSDAGTVSKSTSVP